MDSKALSQTSIALGARVLAAVDKLGLQPEGAFWLFDEAADEWQFNIVTSLIDVAGPRWMFLRLNKALPKIVAGLPENFELYLGSPNEVLALEVRSALSQVYDDGDDQSPVTLDFGEGENNLVVYRISPPMSPQALHRARVVFRKKVREVNNLVA